MATVVNNLYPPILPDTQSAFLRTGATYKIYFALSQYNNLEDIKNVQISLINQKTNRSALNPSKYPSEIKIINNENNNFHKISDSQSDYNYYIELSTAQANSDIINRYFQVNQYYIVQMRFTLNDPQVSNPPQSGGLDAWLSENKQYFSEWSTISLLKGIDQPLIQITGLTENSLTEFSSSFDKIIGKLYYNNSSENEYLKSYNINIYKTTAPNISIYKTQQVYTNQYNPNEFNYQIPYDFDKGVNHTLKFTYTTNNGYTQSLFYNFKIKTETQNDLDGVLNIIPEEENGRIKIDIDFEHTIQTDENLIIKRASSETNFKIWETIKKIPHTLQSLRNVWYDTTIASGIWYKYRIQQETGEHRFIESDEPTICTFEDMYLTNGNKQLKIKFNPSIGDFKYNVMDSQQVTLGSQYPYMKRNGNNYFRSFSIGGLISALIDDNDWYNTYYYDEKFRIENKRDHFSTPFELYKESKKLYNEYNLKNNINRYQDYIYERQFRQEVLNFLYKNDVKLFRSLTEGNILVKLQNVAFQPVVQLGRRLYSFSATAVEIDDFTIANFIKYNIINKYYYTYKIGTITGQFNGKESIINCILNTSNFSNYNTESFKIFKLDIKLNQQQNAVIYVKTLHDNQMIRYETKFGELILNFDEYDEPIEDCYFYGVHLDESQYTLTDNYYYTTNEVLNPTNGLVCYIYESPAEDKNVYRVNEYISYNNRERLLITEEKEVEQVTSKNPHYYVLLLDGIYQRYIYYNNNWYPFSDTGDVLMKTNATITYYYETKEMN